MGKNFSASLTKGVALGYLGFIHLEASYWTLCLLWALGFVSCSLDSYKIEALNERLHSSLTDLTSYNSKHIIKEFQEILFPLLIVSFCSLYLALDQG